MSPPTFWCKWQLVRDTLVAKTEGNTAKVGFVNFGKQTRASPSSFMSTGYLVALGLKDLHVRNGVANAGAGDQAVVRLWLENVGWLQPLMSQSDKGHVTGRPWVANSS